MAELRNGVLRRVEIEATGGHRELTAICEAVAKAVDQLRVEAAREQASLSTNVPVTLPQYVSARINLEGTIKVETEDDL